MLSLYIDENKSLLKDLQKDELAYDSNNFKKSKMK